MAHNERESVEAVYTRYLSRFTHTLAPVFYIPWTLKGTEPPFASTCCVLKVKCDNREQSRDGLEALFIDSHPPTLPSISCLFFIHAPWFPLCLILLCLKSELKRGGKGMTQRRFWDGMNKPPSTHTGFIFFFFFRDKGSLSSPLPDFTVFLTSEMKRGGKETCKLF